MTTPKLKKVVVDSIDISDSILEFEISRKYSQYITNASIVLSVDVKDSITLDDSLVGKSVTIQRGISSATEKYIFRGEVRNIEFKGAFIKLDCADKLYEAVRTKVTYSYDINVDDEAGVVSEIFKDLINTYTSLTANSTSVQDSSSIFTLDKFICRDAPIYERLSDLAKGMNWQFFYDPDDDLVYFEPKGFTSSSTILEVGENITKVPKWLYNSDMLANQITVRGAEQLVESTEFFDGDGTNDQEVQLTKTPVSVKVYVGSGSYDPTGTGTRPSDNEGTLKTGGKDGSTSGTYYYVYDNDSNIRKVIFGSAGSNPEGVPASGTNNIEVRYTYKLPVPVVGRNQTSIDKYGLNEKVIVKSDLKNVDDAEKFMQKELNKYSEIFATTELNIVEEEDLEVGRTYEVIDNINDIEGVYLLTEIKLIYPNNEGDEVTVGDELWKTDDWNVEVWDRLKRLEEQQTETTDLLVDVRKFNRQVKYKRRYFLAQIKSVAGSTGIYGHPTFGIYGTAVYGASTAASFILGHTTFGVLGTSTLGESGTATFQTIRLVPGNNIYEEYVKDTIFEGSGTATWDTSNKKITFTAGQTTTTSNIALGTEYSYFTVTLGTVTGSILTEISADNGTNWQTVTLGTRTAFTNSDTSGVLFRFTENNSSAAEISTTFNSYDTITAPAIKCKLEE